MSELTEDKVLRLLGNHFAIPVADIKTHNAIVNDLGADSIDTIEIVMYLEDEFDIVMNECNPINTCDTFTVQDAINMINSLLADK